MEPTWKICMTELDMNMLITSDVKDDCAIHSNLLKSLTLHCLYKLIPSEVKLYFQKTQRRYVGTCNMSLQQRVS